jgi:hypothetical protein
MMRRMRHVHVVAGTSVTDEKFVKMHKRDGACVCVCVNIFVIVASLSAADCLFIYSLTCGRVSLSGDLVPLLV